MGALGAGDISIRCVNNSRQDRLQLLCVCVWCLCVCVILFKSQNTPWNPNHKTLSVSQNPLPFLHVCLINDSGFIFNVKRQLLCQKSYFRCERECWASQMWTTSPRPQTEEDGKREREKEKGRKGGREEGKKEGGIGLIKCPLPRLCSM